MSTSTAPAANSPKPRRWTAIAFLALLIGIPAAGLYTLKNLIVHEPEAHRHVPDGTNIAFRADAAKLLAFKPVREHLLPVLLEKKDDKQPAESARVKRIKALTGVNIPIDLREFIVASVDGKAWVLLVGGKLEPGRIVDGLETLFKEEKLTGWTRNEDLLVHSIGTTIGQADDGTFIVGSNTEIVKASLPKSEKPVAIPVPVNEALSLMMHERAWTAILRFVPSVIPGVDELKQVQGVTGTFALTETPALTLELTPKQGVTPKTLASQAEGVLQKARLALLLTPGEMGGAKGAIRKATVSTTPVNGPKRVVITAPWSYSIIERGFKEVAEALRAVAPPPSP